MLNCCKFRLHPSIRGRLFCFLFFFFSLVSAEVEERKGTFIYSQIWWIPKIRVIHLKGFPPMEPYFSTNSMSMQMFRRISFKKHVLLFLISMWSFSFRIESIFFSLLLYILDTQGGNKRQRIRRKRKRKKKTLFWELIARKILFALNIYRIPHAI